MGLLQSGQGYWLVVDPPSLQDGHPGRVTRMALLCSFAMPLSVATPDLVSPSLHVLYFVARQPVRRGEVPDLVPFP